MTNRLIGCHFRKVEKIRKGHTDGTPEIQEAVKNDRMSINRAYDLIRKMERGVVEGNQTEKLSAAQLKAVKLFLSQANLAELNALGGDLSSLLNSSLLNLSVEQFISGLGDKERTADPATEAAGFRGEP